MQAQLAQSNLENMTNNAIAQNVDVESFDCKNPLVSDKADITMNDILLQEALKTYKNNDKIAEWVVKLWLASAAIGFILIDKKLDWGWQMNLVFLIVYFFATTFYWNYWSDRNSILTKMGIAWKGKNLNKGELFSAFKVLLNNSVALSMSQNDREAYFDNLMTCVKNGNTGFTSSFFNTVNELTMELRIGFERIKKTQEKIEQEKSLRNFVNDIANETDDKNHRLNLLYNVLRDSSNKVK